MKKRSVVLVTMLMIMVGSLFAQAPNPASDFQYSLNRAGNGVVITKYTGTGTTVNIPSKIEGFPVVEIGNSDNRAFASSRITSVIFPDTDIIIGTGAFSGSSLTSVTLPNTIKDIGTNAFAGCGELQTVTINMSVSDRNWNPSGIFGSCTNLRTVTFTSSWVIIPSGMFNSCRRLATIVFPDNLKIIGDGAFANTDLDLNRIILPEGIEEIRSDAFQVRVRYGSPRVTETLTLPEGLHTIGENAFRDKKINKLVLPSTITTIHDQAFYLTGITEVIIPESVTRISFPSRGYPPFSGLRLNLQSQAALRRVGYTGSL